MGLWASRTRGEELGGGQQGVRVDSARRGQRRWDWTPRHLPGSNVWPGRVGFWGLVSPEGMGVAASRPSCPVAPTLGSSTWQVVFSLGLCTVGSRVSTLTRAAHALSKTNNSLKSMRADRAVDSIRSSLPENLPELQPCCLFSLLPGAARPLAQAAREPLAVVRPQPQLPRGHPALQEDKNGQSRAHTTISTAVCH